MRSWFVLWPFGRTVIRSTQGGCLEVGFNILWLVFAGWSLFLAHLVAGVILCITIIGIPFGIQAFKLSVLSLWPFGRSVVSSATVGTGQVVYAVPADPTTR